MSNTCLNDLYVFSKSRYHMNQFMISGADLEKEEPLSLEMLYPAPDGADEEWKEYNWGTIGLNYSELKFVSNQMLYYRLETKGEESLWPWLQEVAMSHPDLCFFMRYQASDCSRPGGCVAKGDDFANTLIHEHLMLKILEEDLENGFGLSEDDQYAFHFNIVWALLKDWEERTGKIQKEKILF